ncbi:MAG TPA: glucan biosynthesis protein G [Candidatus Limnocylindrales bacterium]|nr:glucan biosynthesis protein G [Candidatus Limnocylindrales bacterium]
MPAGARVGRTSVAAADETVRARGRIVWPAALTAAILAVAIFAVPVRSLAFTIEDVAEKAAKLAAEPYQDPSGQVPQWLIDMSYDQWRDVRFRADRALWKDRALPFEVQFFHPGLFYDRIVAINEVDAGGVTPVTFSPSMFDYGKNDFASRVPQDLGFAGFRLHYPIKNATYKDEVIVFVGATYFRAVGKDEVFGISARGLAIDTASPSGEEFPYFREYWLVRPTKGATDMAVYALLDSPSLTGAYKFVIYPGQQTVVEVEGRIFRRKDVAKLGIAPLTSMFMFGENSIRCFDNYRPEVHDSDGLLLYNDTGEWLWRPVDNPTTLQVHGYQMTNPRGFGVLQRDRDFASYQDLETHQERRPSTWIVPKGQWGPGRVELVEIPTPQDIHDNIVAYWLFDQLPPLGQPINFAYKIFWYGDDVSRPPAGRATATRREKGTAENRYRFVVDFEGKALAKLPADEVLRAAVTVTGGDAVGRIIDQYVIKVGPTDAWRLGFQVEVAVREPVELRAYLDKAGSALTETWSYTLIP